MAGKITDLTSLPTANRATNVLEVVDVGGNASYKVTPNFILGISGNPVGDTDSQTLTNKILTAPTISSPVLSGTITGTYTFGGTPTFPAAVVTLTGSQTLTNKILTSPTLSSPTLTNASITQDAVVGFTSANNGTMYGIAITASKMSGANLTNSTVGPNQLATGAQAAFVSTTETTASATYAFLATTTDQVTVTIGVNGLAQVFIAGVFFNSGANDSFVGIDISGATTTAATDAMCIRQATAAAMGLGASFLITGLAAGSTTFKLKYRVSAGTGSFLSRRIAVVPL